MAQERRFVRSFFGVSSLAVLTVAAGLAASCKDKPADTAPVPAATDAAVALPTASAPLTAMADGGGDGGGRGDHEGPRDARSGPGSMLFQAARSLELSADQKAKVAAAETTAQSGGETSRDAMKTAGKDLHTDLIAGVRAGKIDTTKLEPRYAAIEKAIGESQAKEADGLNALHAALDATQRKAVTANVRAKQAMREEKMAHREGGDAGADGGKPMWSSKRSVDRLVRGLDLDADQQKKVDAVVAKEDAAKHPDPAEMKKNLDAMLTAFEKDTFDAKKLDLFDSKKMRGPMEQETKLLGQIVPILKPEQREKLAAKMEKGPNPHAGRGAGFRPRPMMEEGEDE
jgi:Spy/CpxP family protein refolding chaperone